MLRGAALLFTLISRSCVERCCWFCWLYRRERGVFEHFILWKNILASTEQRYSRAPNIPDQEQTVCVLLGGEVLGFFFTWDARKTLAFVRLMVRWHLEFCKKPICSGDRASACAVSVRLPNHLGSSCKRLISFFLPCRSWVPVTHTAFILSHLTHTPAQIRAAVTNRLTHIHKPKKKQARHK